MIDTLKKGKDFAVNTWNKAKYALPVCATLICSSCDKGDDDPVVPTNNPIEVNKSRETVNELSDEIKQDVIAYFQNIFCPIWNALWPDRPDLQFNPEDFVDIINNADVRYGDEYFVNKSEGIIGYYTSSGYGIRLRPDVDFDVIIHEFIHYLLSHKHYPETEDTKRILEIALGKLVSSDPTYDPEEHGEKFTTVNQAKAKILQNMATSSGERIQDITVDELRQHIDEMQDCEIIRAFMVNGYIDHEQFQLLYDDAVLVYTIERLAKSLAEVATPSQNFLKDYFYQHGYEDKESYTEEERFVKELISKNRWKIKEMPISEVRERLNKKLKELPSQETLEEELKKYQEIEKYQAEHNWDEVIQKYGYFTEIEVVMKELEEQSKMVDYVGGNDNQRKELIDRVLNKIKREREHFTQEKKEKIEEEIQTYQEKMKTNPKDYSKRMDAMRHVMKYIASVDTINFSDAQEMYCNQKLGGNESTKQAA